MGSRWVEQRQSLLPDTSLYIERHLLRFKRGGRGRTGSEICSMNCFISGSQLSKSSIMKTMNGLKLGWKSWPEFCWESLRGEANMWSLGDYTLLFVIMFGVGFAVGFLSMGLGMRRK